MYLIYVFLAVYHGEPQKCGFSARQKPPFICGCLAKSDPYLRLFMAQVRPWYKFSARNSWSSADCWQNPHELPDFPHF
ncbi:hypothetical protein RSOLAG1IB_03801 [Rhizoctonia solani AG-1 IB]|uniref:Uncharacterized protein n=1 Tax=Thanatephorus cucumeris (strain AG1-IB / isolate 7/3/14) TaxID=1108050 RepID=A0A0B7FUK4_THACB|nr:hypothetical protein RSOLAG1IB_03801 [Rhizoctonia solani AG-1 IB]